MVGYASKRRLGEKPKEGIRNRRRSAQWYEEVATEGLAEGDPGARLIARPLGNRAVLDYEFSDPNTMRQLFPDLWRRLEPRLRTAGVAGHVSCVLEDPRHRRWIEPVLIGQLFEPPERDYVVLERKSALGEGVEPVAPVGYSLRAHKNGDEQALFPTLRYAFDDEYTEPEDVRRDLNASDWTVVAEHGSEPVGLCSIDVNDGLAWVDSLAVASGHRGRGLGEALLLAGLVWARDHQPGPVRLYTDFWRNEALNLYKKHGFSQAYTAVQFRRPMDPAVIEEILSRRKATYSRWVGFR